MKKVVSFILLISFISSIIPYTYAQTEINNNFQLHNSNTSYGIPSDEQITTMSFWDIVDVAMAGWSWKDFFNEPSWGNFGYAILDTAAIAPLVPSSG